MKITNINYFSTSWLIFSTTKRILADFETHPKRFWSLSFGNTTPDMHVSVVIYRGMEEVPGNYVALRDERVHFHHKCHNMTVLRPLGILQVEVNMIYPLIVC